jgi:hypothetical protein
VVGEYQRFTETPCLHLQQNSRYPHTSLQGETPRIMKLVMDFQEIGCGAESRFD